jgi:hypothetical protein
MTFAAGCTCCAEHEDSGCPSPCPLYLNCSPLKYREKSLRGEDIVVLRTGLELIPSVQTLASSSLRIRTHVGRSTKPPPRLLKAVARPRLPGPKTTLPVRSTTQARRARSRTRRKTGPTWPDRRNSNHPQCCNHMSFSNFPIYRFCHRLLAAVLRGGASNPNLPRHLQIARTIEGLRCSYVRGTRRRGSHLGKIE